MFRFLYATLIGWVLLTPLAYAHSEVFANVFVKAVFSQDGFVGVENHWTFDEEFSESKLAMVDKNFDGKISQEEGEVLMHDILDNLESRNYCNYVLSGTKFLKEEGIKEFKAEMVNGRLVLNFVVAFSEPSRQDYSMLVVVVDDLSNSVQMISNMEISGVVAPPELDVEYFSDSLSGLTLFRAFRSDVRGLFIRYRSR